MAMMKAQEGQPNAAKSRGFITDEGMNLVQDADQFLPLMKTLLARCNAENQKHLLRYLLSIQQAPSGKGPSMDPVDLRIQFERDQEELREVRALLDQFKQQRLEKIEETNKMAQRIVQLESEL